MNFKVLISAILAVFIASCSANYHIRKAIKKGYRCDSVADTIQVTSIDSIPYILHDSIYWEKVLVQKDTIIRYKRSFVPQTRWQTKIEYKLKRDTIRQVQKIEVAKYKSQKPKPDFWVLILGFVMGMGTMYLFRYSKNNL
jgi:hypothetical protein